MAKQLNVNLGFTADVSQAKQALSDLNHSLKSISNININGSTDLLNQDMQKAISSAKQLQTHLQQAINSKTGNIDLSVLNNSLKSANTDLATLTTNLLKCGTQGQQAFMNVQKVISNASVQIKQANGVLGEFWTTLKNTARWQLSSTVLHGFMGAMQSAYGYAKDLDKSLNNIRIVTGYNADEMAKFAEQANKAAKNLNTTTTAYTNASLIYYQQGLKGSEVTERSDVTVKMANVTGEAASSVSDYMTAIWNNFDDGSKSLEYYADVMTALGAATASSTDEIAAGLEKFAAVSETVGLSYEYATSALATVTATTRQSADVVGNAFKTLFSRIQGLNLGETLDDGTDLNKYSAALDKVGISIKDVNGDVKEMDTILDELGNRWGELAKDEQLAVAQTVAGVRQYTQLIALMDNWDFFQENLGTAKNSEGELNKQAEIYAESWEAANKKVKAALQGIYQDLIPEEFIIKFTNGLADVIDGVDGVIDSIGGLKTILLAISSIVLGKMGPSITNTINTGIEKILSFKLSLSGLADGWKPFYIQAQKAKEVLLDIGTVGTGNLNEQLRIYQDSIKSSNTSLLSHSVTINKVASETQGLSNSFKKYLADTQQVYNLQGIILNNKKNLTAAEQEELSIMQQELLVLAEKKQKQQEYLDSLQNSLNQKLQVPNMDLYESAGFNLDEKTSSFLTSLKVSNQEMTKLKELASEYGTSLANCTITIADQSGYLKATASDTEGISNAAAASAKEYAKLVEFAQNLSNTAKNTGADFNKLKQNILNTVNQTNKIPQSMKKAYQDALGDVKTFNQLQSAILKANRENVTTMNLFARSCGNSKENLSTIEAEVLKIIEAQLILNNKTFEYNNALQTGIVKVSNLLDKAVSVGSAMSKLAQGASTVAMGISSISSAIKTFQSPDTTWIDKLSAGTFAAVSGIKAAQISLQGLSSTFKAVEGVVTSYTAAKAALNVISKISNNEIKREITNSLGLLAVDQGASLVYSKEEKARIAKLFVQKLNIQADQQEAFVSSILQAENLREIMSIIQENAALQKNTQQQLLNKAAKMGMIAVYAAIAVAIGAVVVALIRASKAEERALESAAEATKKLKEEAEEAKQQVEAIQNSFESYDSVVEALKECEKGTNEWYETLEKVKNEIDNIIELVPNLLQYEDALEWDDETGTYLLNQERLKEEQQRVENQSQVLNLGAQMGQGGEYYLKASQEKEKLTGMLSGTVNSNINVDDFISQYQYEDPEKIKSYLREQKKSSIMQDYGISEDNEGPISIGGTVFDSLDAYVDTYSGHFDLIIQSMTKYSEAFSQASTIVTNGAKNMASEIYGDKSKAEQDIFAKKTNEKYNEIYQEVLKQSGEQYGDWNLNSSMGTRGGDEDILKRYAEAKDTEYNWTRINGNDDDRKYYFKNQGQTEEDFVTPEDIAAAVAAYESVYAEESKLETEAAMDTVANILKDATTAGANLISNLAASETTQQGLNSFASTLTPEQLAALQGGVHVDNNGDGQYGTVESVISDTLGMSLEEFNALAESLNISGEELAIALQESVTKQIEAQAEAKENILKEATKTTRDLLSGATDNLSTTATSNIVDAVETALGESGKAGAEVVANMFDKAGAEGEEFAQVIDDIDWETVDAETLGAELKAAGVDTNYTTEELIAFIDAMNGVKESTKEAAQEMFTSFQELGNLKMGDTVSQEQMDQMIAQNPALIKYFQQGVDGNYTLTEDTAHFQGLTEDLSYKGQYDYIDRLEDRYNKMNALSESNFDYASVKADMANAAILTGRDSPEPNIDKTTYSDSVSGSLDYLSAMGYDSAKINDWSSRSDSLESADYYDISQALKECGDATGNWDEEMSELENTMGEAENAIDFSRYKDQVSDLGLDFETTERYAQELKEAMEESGKEYDNIEHSARQVAIANQRLDRGLSNLTSNLDDYKEKLKDTNKYSVEYGEALQGLKTDVADIFNTDASLLSDGFIEEQLVGDPEKLVQIANGNMEVINGMRQAVAEEIITNVKTRVDASELDQFNAWYAQFQANFPDLQAGVFLDGQSEAAFIESLNGMIAAAGMTHDEVNALLGSMGMSAELETTYKSQMVEVPIYTTMTKETGSTTASGQRTLPDGTVEDFTDTYPTTETMTYQSGVAEMQGFVPVTSIKTIADNGTESGGGIDIHTSSDSSGAPSGRTSSAPSISPSASNVYNPSTGKGGYTGNKNSSGGGGGGPKEPQKVDLTDADGEVDRYKEIDDVLESIERQLKKIQRTEDTLYGASKIAAMEHETQVLKQQEAAYRQKASAAASFLEADRAALAGSGAVFNSEGYISNYNQVVQNAVASLNAVKEAYNGMTAEQQEAYKETLEQAEERYNTLKSNLSQYEESLQTMYDAEEAAEEARIARLQKNYEILYHELEYKLYNYEAHLEEIDYYLSKYSDNFYKMAEGLALMSDKMDENFNVLGQYSVFVDKLHSQYAAGEITQADYIDGLKESHSSILDTLDALNELDKEMIHYYGETLDAANEELNIYTDHMEHLIEVMDHYKNIMSLLGRTQDYASLDAILKGQVSIRKDLLEVANSNYEMLLDQKAAIEASMNSAEEGSAEWEVYRQQWEDIVVAVDEAQDEMLSNTESWLEAERALVENQLQWEANELEKTLTEAYGGSFDEMSKKMEALRQHSEEYLTETNKIYETNKLIRTAQNDLDKATNESAKKRIKNYLDETKALQGQNEVSQLELEIQQAKYDLLLAEIALEEAQNAKSMVRLQRDSEGNFGYVYTADQDAVSAAEQQYEDAQNNLYNIGLEGAANYADKYAQTMQDMVDELNEIHTAYLEGSFANEEEYHAAIEAAKERYYTKLENYASLYSIAMNGTGEDIQDSWTTAFGEMISKTDSWQSSTNTYTENAATYMEQWQQRTQAANQIVGTTLDETKSKVNDLTNESKALANEVTGDVIPAIIGELNSVLSLTNAYAQQRAEILAQIAAYEALARAIRDTIAAEAALNSYQASSSDLSGSAGGSAGGGADSGMPDYSALMNQAWAEGDMEKYEEYKRLREQKIAMGYSDYGVSTDQIDQYLHKYGSISSGYWTDINWSGLGIFNTGGYTGEWGPEGKLAVLHEKEIVLNPKDTTNFLTAIDWIRELVQEIDLGSSWLEQGLKTIDLPMVNNPISELQQEVRIEANFPSVTDRHEIENAFENLVNKAAQFAGRKKI